MNVIKSHRFVTGNDPISIVRVPVLLMSGLGTYLINGKMSGVRLAKKRSVMNGRLSVAPLC